MWYKEIKIKNITSEMTEYYSSDKFLLFIILSHKTVTVNRLKPLNNNVSISLLFYSRLNPFGLIIAPDEKGLADGLLFWDDGVGKGK
jgi:hypothetical protein